ncbi:MAG: CHAT domain-containing protein [Myxococcaceae bacterium]|nr:MAG: CHAT domain-containing protein [Myxococcaceae bacterium]
MRLARIVVALVVVLISGEARAIADLWEAPPTSIAECSARVRRASNVGSWYCFYRLSFEHRDLIPAVVAHLERIRAREPRNALATFAEALAEDLRGGDNTLALYEQAQAEFRRRGDVEGELHVAAAVVGHASWFGEAELGAAKLARGLVLAQQLGDPDALAYMYVHATELALRTGDYGRAEVRVRQAEEQLTPAAPPWLAYRVPHDWGRVYSATRRPWRAMQAYQRAAAATPDPVHRAFSLQGCAEEAVRLASAGELSMEEAERHLDEALAAARLGVASYHTGGELPTRMLRHALRGPSPEGVREVQAVLERGRATQSFLQITAARLLARFAAETDPRHPGPARVLTDEALSEARSTGNPTWVPLAHLARAHVEWRSGDREALGRQAELMLDSVDRLRWNQPRALARARTSAEWAFAYELLAGWLLDLAGPEPSDGAVEPAFATMERLRGRILLDELTRAGVAPPTESPDLAARRADVLASLTRGQQGLLRHEGGAGREGLRQQVEAAEVALSELEDEVARSDPRSAPVSVATLAELQAALREDEALLSFQLWRPDISLNAPYPAGASWLVVLTRGEVFIARLADAQVLEPKLALFRSLLVRGDSGEVPAGVRLREALLDRALERLPPQVRSLLVVPDGPLHGFPLDALVMEDGSPLGGRYAVTTVPSASLWLRWRRAARPVVGPALALADPDPSAPPGRDRDASRWLEQLRLPSLPEARAEAAAMVEARGPGGALRRGPEASERWLKTSDLRPWGLMHFATHAVVDETEPERSALVLAAGHLEEDGLLQPREIAGLDLGGKIVLLSACRTASGELLQGEGTLGPVRAFFRAGALAVVASPWPLGDLETRKLIDELSERLASGLSLEHALAGAKKARQEAGAPAVAWAGLQLHGDGSVVVSARSTARRGSWAVGLGMLGLALFLVGAAGLVFRARAAARAVPAGQVGTTTASSR